MVFFKRPIWFLPVCYFLIVPCYAEEQHLVDHFDPITIDAQLTLSDVINLTLEKYPDAALIPALQEEAEALQRRGNNWLAAAPSAFFYYWDDTVGADTGRREIDGAIVLPLWNWGQRDAGQQLAKQAFNSSRLQEKVIKLQIAGLVRQALWNMALEKNRHDMAERVYLVSERLVNTVSRRVELGDLPRTDLLLAQTELLAHRTRLVNTEANFMHARKRYSTLTQQILMPANFIEAQSQLDHINEQHPVLIALEAFIKRKKAELQWVKSAGSGQTTFALGTQSDRDSRFGDSVTGMSFAINVPFGGNAHLAPDIAAANLELTKAVVQRDQFYRELERTLHEAKHVLQVDGTGLNIALQRKEIAEQHLKMTQLSFDAGEINLIDLLRIQTISYAAIEGASERKIKLQRDIALYNQAVGVLP
jgi:outer membrane protein, heavy metal efflux system